MGLTDDVGPAYERGRRSAGESMPVTLLRGGSTADRSGRCSIRLPELATFPSLRTGRQRILRDPAGNIGPAPRRKSHRHPGRRIAYVSRTTRLARQFPLRQARRLAPAPDDRYHALERLAKGRRGMRRNWQ